MKIALIFFNIINTIIIFEYLRLTYGYKYKDKRKNALVILAFYLIHTSVNLLHSVPLNILSEFTLINLTAFCFFKEKIGKFYFNMLFQFYLLSVDLIFTCMSSLLSEMRFSDMQVSISFVPYIIVNFILLLATFRHVINIIRYDFIFLYSDKLRRDIQIIMAAQLIAVATASLFIDQYLSNVTILAIMMVLSLVNAVGVLRFLAWQSKKETREKERLYDHFNMTLRHSIRNEKTQKDALGRIIAMHAAKMKKEETQRERDAHIEKLKNQVSGVIFGYNCGNDAIETIVNSIIGQAKAKGIEFKENITMHNWNFINDKDAMIIILGLASNAIETISGERKIELKIKEGRSAKMIEVIHTFDKAQMEKSEGRYFPSSNTDVKIRTNLAAEIAAKYKGDLSFEIEKEKFHAIVILPAK